MSVTFQALDATRPQSFTCSDGEVLTHPSRVELPDWEWGGPNFHNAGGAAIVRILAEATGTVLDTVQDSISIHEARRALWAAQARFEQLALKHTFEGEIVHGEPRTDEDGVVELRPVRVINCGLDMAGIERRFGELCRFIDDAVSAGATDISWA
jgi:hypothetical protein